MSRTMSLAALSLASLGFIASCAQKEPEMETSVAPWNEEGKPIQPFEDGDAIVFDQIIPTTDGAAYGIIRGTNDYLQSTGQQPGVWYLKHDRAYPVTVVVKDSAPE